MTNCSFDTGTLFVLLAFSHLKSQIHSLSHNFILVFQKQGMCYLDSAALVMVIGSGVCCFSNGNRVKIRSDSA